jgi:hypothetical protein
MRPMLIINGEGEYEYEEGTRQLKASEHPVYEARIDLALGRGSWLYAPAEGHDLEKYAQAKQSAAKIDEFQKDLAYYLDRYDPRVADLLGKRGAVSLNLEIAAEALDGERL